MGFWALFPRHHPITFETYVDEREFTCARIGGVVIPLLRFYLQNDPPAHDVGDTGEF
ncbi:MAG TPA: hypothetical protein VNV63_04960 [Nitrospiria bacterium]|nr:hypothetical protein [Nitrospiria bacterium]